jgi:hypothetical protein
MRMRCRQQRCNNFKDLGVADYGGALFQLQRDRADEIFSKCAKRALHCPKKRPKIYAKEPCIIRKGPAGTRRWSCTDKRERERAKKR